MARYGDYETTRLLSAKAFVSVFMARRVEGDEPETAVVRALDISGALEEGQDPHLRVERFLEAARVQQRAAEGSRHWAAVRELGKAGTGAFFVTAHFPQSVDRLLRGRVQLNHAALFALIDQIVRGLDDLKEGQGRPHGNLKPTNVLIRHARVQVGHSVALADPLPTDLLGTRGPGADMEDLGRMLYWIVEGREFGPRTAYPVEDSPQWGALGRTGKSWRALCNLLLDPQFQADPRLDTVRQRLDSMRARHPLVLPGIAVVAVALIGVTALAVLHRSRNVSDTGNGNTPPPGPGDTRPTSEPSLLTRLMEVRNPARSFSVVLDARVGACRDGSGQCIQLTVKADRDCHVLLLSRASDHVVSLLLPNASHRDIVALRDTPLQLPPEGQEFYVTAPYGRTEFRVIATTRRVRLVGATPSSTDPAAELQGITALAVEGASRQETDLSKLLEAQEWATCDVQLLTQPAGDASAGLYFEGP